MPIEVIAHLAVAVWWSFAGLIFFALTERGEGGIESRLAVTVLWPVFVPIGLIMILYRIPVKTTKAIRTDLKNRKLLKEFEKFLETRNDQ